MGFCAVVEAELGGGKTTALSLIKRLRSSWRFHQEEIPTDLLGAFYQDNGRWGFTLQVRFATQRLLSHERAAFAPGDEMHVLDRGIHGDIVFARTVYERGGFTDAEWATYCRLLDMMLARTPDPDLVVYLDSPVEALMRNIRKRGRVEEEGVTVDYVTHLKRNYEEWLDWMGGRCTVIRLPWRDFGGVEGVHRIVDAVERTREYVFQSTLRAPRGKPTVRPRAVVPPMAVA